MEDKREKLAVAIFMSDSNQSAIREEAYGFWTLRSLRELNLTTLEGIAEAIASSEGALKFTLNRI
jgi:hypothetical protein